jgi:two-component system response regulator FixJ
MADDPVVHVIDDDEAVRQSLALLFECTGMRVRTYASAVAFLAVAPDLGTGCVVTDLRMPDLDGLALQRALRELGAGIPVIVMTGHGDVPVAVQALKSGAADFIEKPFDDEAMLASVRRAVEASQRDRERAAEVEGIATRLSSLTPRERQVLDQLVIGQPNKIIAHDLGASPRTVEVHRARVMEKMAARNLSDLVRMVLALSANDNDA